MGEPMNATSAAAAIGKSRAYIEREIREGRLPVVGILGSEIVIDSEALDAYVAEHMGNGIMNERQLARYLGLSASNVIAVMRRFRTAARLSGKAAGTCRYYDIDSPVMQHIFQITGWSEYAKPNGHAKGKTFPSEHERRAAARRGKFNRTAPRER